ncbi:MAG: Fic family protein [Gammaproteobacteria bacterium]
MRPDWPAWRWSERVLATALASARRKGDYLAGLARAFEGDQINLAITELTTQETVSTSAIEGVRLDANAVRSSIMRRLGLDTSDEQASRAGADADGVIDILADSTQNTESLTLQRLFTWHSALFPTGRSGLSRILVGALRGNAPMQVLSGPIGRERVHYEAPPRERLDAEMERFLKWFNEPPVIDSTLRACLAHLWFETLHPFEDGNGRIARAVFDLALAQGARFHSERVSRLWAVSPVILRQRKAYYAQLEHAQKGDLDITEWLKWSVASVDVAYDASRACIERVASIANFWLRNREAPLNPRQRKILKIALSPNDAEDGWITARRVARWAKVERVTASRDLAHLEKLGLIRKDPTAGGRNTRYEVSLPEPRVTQLIRQPTY